MTSDLTEGNPLGLTPDYMRGLPLCDFREAVLESLPVSQQGRVFFVDYYLWGSHTRGPLTDKLILEALPDLLLGSVERADSK